MAANYSGRITDVTINYVDTGIYQSENVNGWHRTGIHMVQIQRYSYRNQSNSENSTIGGLAATSSSSLISVIQEEGTLWPLYYGVQAEPGGSGIYFNTQEGPWLTASGALQQCSEPQVHGHSNCGAASTIGAGTVDAIVTQQGQGVIDSGTTSSILGLGAWKPVPIAIGSGQYLTVEQYGGSTKYHQLGLLSSTPAVWLGNITPGAGNYALFGDGVNSTVVNAPGATALGYLRANNAEVVKWGQIASGLWGIWFDNTTNNFVWFGSGTSPSSSNFTLFGDGTNAALNAATGGTASLRVANVIVAEALAVSSTVGGIQIPLTGAGSLGFLWGAGTPSGTNFMLAGGSADTYVNADTALHFRIANGATDYIGVNSTGIGFYNATPVAKPTVSGSKSANAALGSLMTALANLGLVTDSTT